MQETYTHQQLYVIQTSVKFPKKIEFFIGCSLPISMLKRLYRTFFPVSLASTSTTRLTAVKKAKANENVLTVKTKMI